MKLGGVGEGAEDNDGALLRPQFPLDKTPCGSPSNANLRRILSASFVRRAACGGDGGGGAVGSCGGGGGGGGGGDEETTASSTAFEGRDSTSRRISSASLGGNISNNRSISFDTEGDDVLVVVFGVEGGRRGSDTRRTGTGSARAI